MNPRWKVLSRYNSREREERRGLVDRKRYRDMTGEREREKKGNIRKFVHGSTFAKCQVSQTHER